MQLRDVVGTLVGLEDQRRALAVEAARSLADLEGVVAGDGRLSAVTERIASLRDDMSLGLDESSSLGEVSSALSRAVMTALRGACAETLASSADASSADADTSLDALEQSIEPCLARALSAAEWLGRLRQILARRAEVESHVRGTKGPLGADPETSELVDITLSARRISAEAGNSDPVSSLDVLAGAEQAAAADGPLAAIASNARALRAAIGSGRDASGPASDLIRRIVGSALRIARDRDEQRRRMAALEHEIESRRSVAQGLSQMRRKATLVLGQVVRFERLPEAEQLQSGALGALKAACLEHGIISMMLGLRDLRIDRAALDRSLSELSSALGVLLNAVENRPDVADALSPAWDDLHSVDSRTSEPEWQASLWEVVGLRKDGHGTLSVDPDVLKTLVLADSLEPWRATLLQRIQARTDEVIRATQRLETIDELLTSLVGEGGAPAVAALAVKGAVARFVGESLHVMSDCHERVRDILLRPDTGLAVIGDRLAPFRHVEEMDADATTEARRAAVASTLTELREGFTRTGSDGAAGDGTTAASSPDAGSRTDELLAVHRRLAATLARARRLRELALPPLPQTVQDAIKIAKTLREKGRDALPPSELGLRDRFGEALEALHHERELHRLLDLPTGGDLPALRSLAGERAERLLELSGASITLLFELLTVLGVSYETIGEADRPDHLAWIEELLSHGARDVEAHLILLDERLLDLPSNVERLERHAVVFDAYHGWARSLGESELAMELATRHGERLFARFEDPLARLGATILDGTRTDAADWQSSGALESVIELLSALLARLATRPTFTDMSSRVAALKDRASVLRDDVVERAEQQDPFARGGGGRFG